MASSIGIKIANGEFYPVLGEGSTAKKRLILTTVHDGQSSVQIDLYRSAMGTMADAAYIGSLVVEDIAPRPKGEPSVELVISSDGSDELTAEALDLDSSLASERQHLSVSLQSLDEEKTYDVPDFELEHEATPPPSGLYERGKEIREETMTSTSSSSPSRLPLILGILIGLLLILFIVWYFFLKAPSAPKAVTPAPATPVAAVEPPPPPVIEAPKPAEPAVVEAPKTVEPEPVAAASKRVRPPAPVKSYKIPRVIPKAGVKYKIRWGDTLWDISEAFYRNPWLYPRIARFNKIRNPDLIISGHYLRVPPKK